jgi:transcriptional regulator NrdR family protein
MWRSCGDITVTVQNFSSAVIKTSEYVSAYQSQKISLSFITLLCKAMVSTEGITKEYRVFESLITLLQSYGSKSVGSGRVCLFVT